MRVPPGLPSNVPPSLLAGWMQRLRPHFWRGLAVAALLGLLIQALWPKPPERKLTQQDIDAAVLKTLETAVLPSPAARAAAAIAPSIVRVQSYATNGKGGEEQHGVGTGVVIVNSGIILTNLHVVAGAQRVDVTFFDGSTSPAYISNTQAENDLAVLQARQVPDDLEPATLRSTTGLRPGDGVVAVGFPFGIGPSVSNGVVSGLGRSFRSPEGKQVIGNLIQFDAAANPGNSGGPLVTLDGQVVGIVTAILNPGDQRTFIGIGFAVPIENAATAVGMHPF